MSIYSLNEGMKRVDVAENHVKNSLPVGTVLHLNGYNDPDYVIVKNQGINERFPEYGTRYLVVNPEDYNQSVKDAFNLKPLAEKKDNRIQVYITEEIKTPDEVLTLWEKSEAKMARMKEAQTKANTEADRLEALGRELFKKHIPETAKALIIACYDINESDIQSDYFAHRSQGLVILGYSLHTKDLFSEMRKYAEKLPETKHLGISKGHFEARVIIADDIYSNGSYYNKGQYSRWHREIEQDGKGNIIVFSTKKEAEDYILSKGRPDSITFDGKLISFDWSIEEEELEHREKWSMGSGYYLKDGYSNSTGWTVSKQRKYHSDWNIEVYIALAKRCIF